MSTLSLESPVVDNNLLKDFTERELIYRVRSIHTAYDTNLNVFKVNILAQFFGDERWHWITDVYASSLEIKIIFDKLLRQNFKNYPDDRQVLNDWQELGELWSMNPKKGLSLFNHE